MRKVLVSLAAFAAVFSPSIDVASFLPTVEAQGQQREAVLGAFSGNSGTPDVNAIFALVNNHRVSAGLSPLEPSALLAQVAQDRARDMQANSYYAHQAPDGSYYYDKLDGSVYSNNYSCENLDLRFSLTPNGYVTDWLRSPSHKRCLLSSKVSRAGYAAVKLDSAPSGEDVSAYIVVAIHATE